MRLILIFLIAICPVYADQKDDAVEICIQYFETRAKINGLTELEAQIYYKLKDAQEIKK